MPSANLIPPMLSTETPNITLHGGDKIPCFLCAVNLTVRRDKKGKPYFICNHCGVQSFIRGKVGRSRLRDLQQKINGNTVPALEIVALTQQLRDLRAELKEVQRQYGFFGLSPAEAAAEASLKQQIEKIERRLRVIGSE